MSVNWVCMGSSWPQVQCSGQGLIIARSGGGIYLCDPADQQDLCGFHEISANPNDGLKTNASVMSELHFRLLFELAVHNQEGLEEKYYNNISTRSLCDIFKRLQYEVSQQKTMPQRSISTICSELAEQKIDFFHHADVFEALKIYHDSACDSTSEVATLLNNYADSRQTFFSAPMATARAWLKVSFFGATAASRQQVEVQPAVEHVQQSRSGS